MEHQPLTYVKRNVAYTQKREEGIKRRREKRKMNKRTAIIATALLMAAFLVAPVAVHAQPLPHGISGIVYMSDGVTEAPAGTGFSVNDTTSGDFIEGTTGAGPHSGWYSVSVDGVDGDTVIIRAWNATHYGERTVSLEGDMTGIDVSINTPFGPGPTPPQPHGIQGIIYMSDGVTEAPVGTSFSVNDTTSGDFIEGTTGAGPHSGWYSVSINGEDGDTVIIRAWNETHYSERTVTLAGVMTGIDVIIDTLKQENAKPAITIATDKTTYTTGDILDVEVNISNPSNTPQSVVFGGWLTIPSFGYKTGPIATIPMTLPAGYDQTLKFPIYVGYWSGKSFGAVWCVALSDPNTNEILSFDSTYWNYVPDKAVKAKKSPVSIAKQIRKEIGKLESPH